MSYYTIITSPLCEIILAGDEAGISHLHLDTGEGKRQFKISTGWTRNDAFFSAASAQIQEYFNGSRRKFDLALDLHGSDFQKRVWHELARIPYGELRTYKDIATAVGNQRAARAVGLANSRNPVPLIIPCHRVVGSDGKLTGFAHGLGIKRSLIELEKAALQSMS